MNKSIAMAGTTRNIDMDYTKFETEKNYTRFYSTLKNEEIDLFLFSNQELLENTPPENWSEEEKQEFLKLLIPILKKEELGVFYAMKKGIIPQSFHHLISPELVEAWEEWVERKNLEQQRENRERNEELRKQNQREKELENLFSYHLSIFKKLSIEEKHELLKFQAYNGHIYQRKIMRKMHQKGFRLNTKEEFKDFVFKLALNTAPQEET
jgi:hypothetical protein